MEILHNFPLPRFTYPLEFQIQRIHSSEDIFLSFFEMLMHYKRLESFYFGT